MTNIDIDGRSEPVLDLVYKHANGNSVYNPGCIEQLELEIDRTRSILARLLNVAAEKQLFTDAELVVIIRGY